MQKLAQTAGNYEEAGVLSLLGALIESGVPILEAINLAGGTSKRFEVPMKKMHDEIASGSSFAEALSNSGEFSWFVPRLLGAAENCGMLDKALERASSLLTKMVEISESIHVVNTEEIEVMLDFEIFEHLFVKADLPVSRSLKILARHSSERLRDAWDSVTKEIEKSSTLSEAMAKRPDDFSPHIVAMIKAGESGGILDLILPMIVRHYERKIFDPAHLTLRRLLSNPDFVKSLERGIDAIEAGRVEVFEDDELDEPSGPGI